MRAQLVAEDVVRSQVPSDRPVEIERYLRLYGYRPRETRLEVHLVNPLGRRHQGVVVVGRSHDPVLGFRLLHGATRQTSVNTGYLGYLVAPEDDDERPPHELLPLDFTPSEIAYPMDWKRMFGTEGFLVAMEVHPSSILTRDALRERLKGIGGAINVKAKWDFLDSLSELAEGPPSG